MNDYFTSVMAETIKKSRIIQILSTTTMYTEKRNICSAYTFKFRFVKVLILSVSEKVTSKSRTLNIGQ